MTTSQAKPAIKYPQKLVGVTIEDITHSLDLGTSIKKVSARIDALSSLNDPSLREMFENAMIYANIPFDIKKLPNYGTMFMANSRLKPVTLPCLTFVHQEAGRPFGRMGDFDLKGIVVEITDQSKTVKDGAKTSLTGKITYIDELRNPKAYLAAIGAEITIKTHEPKDAITATMHFDAVKIRELDSNNKIIGDDLKPAAIVQTAPTYKENLWKQVRNYGEGQF